MRVFGIGADILLDHRSQSRLSQVAVAVDSRVDQQVDLVQFAPGLLEAVAGRLDGPAKCAD
jgi:hypothetical protein